MEKKQQEHILVCLSTAPSNARIIRTAAQMARAFQGTLTALYVQTPGSKEMGSADRQRLQDNTRLAQQLGATVATVLGNDVPYQIAEFARISHVSKVVMGRSASTRSRFFGRRPMTESLIELAPHLEIYIIPDSEGKNKGRRNPASRASLLPSWRALGSCGAMLLLATAIGFGFDALHFTEANIITVYLLFALLSALLTKNHLCSALFSLGSVVLFNFFFAEPRFSLQAYETGYPVTVGILLLASILTGVLANRLSQQARQASETASSTKVLLETSQRLQQAQEDREVLEATADQLVKLLERPLVVYSREKGDKPLVFTPENSAEPPFYGEKEVANWVLENKHRAGFGTQHFPQARGLYMAIRSNADAFGVMGIAMGDKPLDPFESSVLLSILGECALALENLQNAREKEAAAVLAKDEQLRANLLRTISHDLRTPLTSISGNAENLLANDAFLDTDSRKAVLTDIYEDSIWLIDLVENLLAITKIEEGRARLNLSAQLVDEVIAEALRHLSRRHIQHKIVVEESSELLLAQMDARLISQVIVNLVDNAIKYTPPQESILIRWEKQGNQIAISVADRGPGIPDGKKERVFDMFFTGESRVADCRRSMGLGLALCKSIVGVHGGQLTLRDNQPSGCVFTFTLPASEVILNE